MSFVIIICAALLPVILLWLYVWRQDAQPEPTRLLVKAFFYGIGICLPVSLLEMGIEEVLLGGEPTTLLGTTVDAFFVAALPEESFKLLARWLILRRNPYFDEHFDGIVYAVSVGLGFAAVENIFYIFANMESWVQVASMRALLAVPGHYAFAVLMGYYYSIYHFTDRSPRTAACILLVPTVAHGIYDALALSTTVSAVAGGIGFMVLIYFCVKMHKTASKKMLAQIERDRQEGFTA